MMRLPAIVAFRGEKLAGTVHEPARDAARTALLLLNPGPAPRAGNSDLSARLGDALARAGVRVFRFDQSGTGDATGESWRTLDDCRAESQRGERPVAEVDAIVDAILARDDTDGVMVGGLCAGATIAMRVADARARSGAGLAGVVILEPDLRRSFSEESRGVRLRKRLRAIRATLAQVPVLGGIFGAVLGSLVARVRRRAGSARPAPDRRSLDPNLLDAWRRTLDRGTPVLAITALDLDADRDLDELVAAVGDPRVHPRASALPDRRRIPDANHLFTLAGSADRVIAEATPWVVAHAAGRSPRPTATAAPRA